MEGDSTVWGSERRRRRRRCRATAGAAGHQQLLSSIFSLIRNPESLKPPCLQPASAGCTRRGAPRVVFVSCKDGAGKRRCVCVCLRVGKGRTGCGGCWRVISALFNYFGVGRCMNVLSIQIKWTHAVHTNTHLLAPPSSSPAVLCGPACCLPVVAPSCCPPAARRPWREMRCR